MQNVDGVCWLQGYVTGAKVGNVVYTVAVAYKPPYSQSFTGWGVYTTTTLGITTTAYNPILC